MFPVLLSTSCRFISLAVCAACDPARWQGRRRKWPVELLCLLLKSGRGGQASVAQPPCTHTPVGCPLGGALGPAGNGPRAGILPRKSPRGRQQREGTWALRGSLDHFRAIGPGR